MPATSSADAVPLLGGCPAYTSEQPFLRWLDIGNYFLMPNGGLEAGATDWQTTGGAGVTAGNESEVLYTNLFDQPRALTVGLLVGGSTWQPTLPVAFLANLLSPPLLTSGTTNVAFRFTPQGSLSGWKIDDVYVDPFKSE